MKQMTKRIITACHLDHKCDPSDHFCPNGSEVTENPVNEFLGADYESKMAILKAAIKPLMAALDETHMQLAVDHRSEYWLTAIPWRDEYAGGFPEGMDTGKLLDATISLGDAQHLVAVID